VKFRFAIIEKTLNRAQRRCKWLRFLQYSFILGCALCAAALLFSAAVHRGLIVSRPAAIGLGVILAGVAIIAWFVILLVIAIRKADPNWLGAALERSDRRFLDRLNTLLFLEKKGNASTSYPFAIRIAQQTKQIFSRNPPRRPFSSGRAAATFGAFLLFLAATILVYRFYSPWPLLAHVRHRTELASEQSKSLELTPPATNNVEQNKDWGEVRITDPGADLKVTKVDVVPLQIEAAANQALQQVTWSSAVNGGSEATHELPPPAEPRYAVYQPALYLDELQLADWDIMTYYARAKTEKENSFASEVYFLEVRPFREDILKMPGGENGKAYRCLSQMTALINRQQHVIRQTHQHIQKPPEQENLRAQDRGKLADAEGDLRDSTEHLYASMATEMENAPIGVALDNLAKACTSLDHASNYLKQNAMTEAPPTERDALTDLVAARKMFQKAVSDNPDAFHDADQNEDEPPRVALDESKKLQKIAEFRNEAQVGRQFVQKAVEQQRGIERQTKAAAANLPKLAQQERQLQQSVEDFQQEHPHLFKEAQSQFQDARNAMSNAAEAMQNRSAQAGASAATATEQLQKFSDAANGRSAGQQLADAYQLKSMLDSQIRHLDDFSKAETNTSSATDIQKTSQDARETINQLKKVAEQEPTRDAFGQPLRDSLAGTNKVDLDTKLSQLEQAQDHSAQQQRAGDAASALARVSRAFDESQPKTIQMARKSDSLKPDAQSSLNLGMSQLESLARQLEKEQKLSPQAQSQQSREALYNLQNGMRSQYGSNERAEQFLALLDQTLKTEEPLEIEDLRKLLSELQHFSAEVSDRLAAKDDPEVTNIDPSRLPPAYRGRIQKYFQKLSEK